MLFLIGILQPDFSKTGRHYMNKMLIKISLSIVIFFFVIPLFAVNFNGFFFVDYYGDIEPTTSYDNLRNRYHFQPSLSGDLFDYTVKYNLSADLFYDPLGDPSLVSPDNFIKPENILKEAYLNIPMGDFDLSFGQKLVSPGMTDVFSPLNIVNGEYAYKLSLDDPYDSKRADLMVQLQYYPNFDDSVQLVYVPFPRPDYEPTGLLNLVIDADVDIDVNFDADPYLVNNAHSIYMVYDHMSSGFDFQLDYAYYIEQTPNFNLEELNNGASLTGTVSTLYTRNHTFGGAYSTSFNGIALVEELAVNITEDFAGTDIGIKNSDITLNSQITWTLYGGIFAQLNVVYQYVINFNQSNLNYPMLIDEFNSYFNQPVEHVAFAIAHFHKSFLREKLYLAVNVAYLYPQVYIAPRVSYALSDEMKIETGADIKTGQPSEYTLARGNLSDNYYLRLKYEF